MTFESILADIQRVCPSKWSSLIEARPLQDGLSCSFYFFNQLGFKFVLRKKVDPFFEIDPDDVVNPSAITPFYSTTPTGTLRLNMGLSFDYNAFLDAVKNICENRRETATVEKFGCCSSFVECSDALRCLHESEMEYLGCYYVKNLESGKIFYGKNKNIPVAT